MIRPTLPLPRRRFLASALAAAAAAAVPWARRSAAEPESGTPYLGEIMLIAGNYPPRNWALCNGQLLPINQNQALFSLLLTTYGGNGVTTFALPDLRGRVAIHEGQGLGLTPRTRGERAGELAHTLLITELPSHTHVARASAAAGSTPTPSMGVVPARASAQIPEWGTTANTVMATDAVAIAGGGQAHQNMQPYLGLTYVIALQGVYPSE